MRAWRAHAHGEPRDVLALEDVEVPAPGPGQLLVAVGACGLNFADVLLCRGSYQERPALPLTPGLEVVGTVVGTGDPAQGLAPGSRVLGPTALPHGGLAERCLVPAAHALPVPDEVDDATAVALYVTFQTAWVGLSRRARLRPGQVVVVHAAAGATGSAFVQVAKAMGARVLATAGGPAKVARCLALGADEALDSRGDQDVLTWIRERTDGRGADVVVDPVGGPLAEASRRAVAFEGRLLVVGFASGEVPQLPANHVLVKNYDVVGLQWPAYRHHRPDVVRRAHEALVDLVRQHRIEPMIGRVAPLEGALDALGDLLARRTQGKLVVRVAPGG